MNFKDKFRNMLRSAVVVKEPVRSDVELVTGYWVEKRLGVVLGGLLAIFALILWTL